MHLPITGIVNSSEAQPGAIVAVQTVLTTVAAATTSVTLTFSNLTDASKCIPFWTARASANIGNRAPNETEFAIDIFDDGGVVKATVSRAAAANGYNSDLAVVLVEFDSSINVAKYSYTTQTLGAALYLDKTITSVNTGAAFVVTTAHGQVGNLTIIGMTGMVCGEITSATNLRLHALANGTTIPLIIAYTVSDPAGTLFTTSKTTATFSGTTTTVDVTVPSHNAANTWPVINFHANSGSSGYPNVQFANKHQWMCNRTSNTNYRFQKTNPNSAPYTGKINVQLVTFSQGVNIQRGTHSHVDGEFTINKTITSVDISKSFVMGYIHNTHRNGQDTAASSSCRVGETSFRMRLTSSTNIELARLNTNPDVAGLLSYQVLTIP